MGIDHTAIAVSDTQASLDFYRDLLGLRVAGKSENYGTQQEHLNQVFGARLHISGLRAPVASGTIAGLLTRRYHGLLVATLNPPLGRTLLLTKFDEIARYNGLFYPLSTNRWAGGTVSPAGYQQIERFSLEGTTPVWQFAFSDARLEKRVWMQLGFNTTYIQYTLCRATQPLKLTLQAFVNYRDYHGSTQGNGWQMSVESINQGIQITAYQGATPLYLLSNCANAVPSHEWYYSFDLLAERDRGLSNREDHLHAATFAAILAPGESLTDGNAPMTPRGCIAQA